ncbi:ATP-binding protein [Methylomonas sp. AM2-LC]|uniref:sensor histidine kinase n=1 Tax=Methylomonas sp. AM2-LC TaxID=3153301 RepID=UPI00326678D6
MKHKIENIDPLTDTVRKQQQLVDTISLWHSLLERESGVIAKELHNDLAQVVLALRLDISLFILQNQADPHLVARANSMLAKADQCNQSISTLVNVLRSPDFSQGLVQPLANLCQEFRRRHKIPCELLINGDCHGIDTFKTSMLYRVISEALNNAVQLSAATRIKITIDNNESRYLCIDISNDGQAYDVNSNNLGILLMREYALAMGAHLELFSKPLEGTQIIITVPLDA